MTDPEITLPPETHVGRVALRVNDLDRLVSFYRDVVGLVVQRSDDTGATLGAGETPLLELLADTELPPRAADETGLFHTAFLVPSRAALGDALGRIRENWTLEGASDHLVSEALYLADPEGNGIEIYRDRPKEGWPIEGDRVGIDTLPLDLEGIADLGTGESHAPAETTIGHVHLEVSSISDSEGFYVENLGMNIRQTVDDSALFVAAGDYHHHLGLNTWNGRTTPPKGRGLAWFELVVPEGALSALRERFGSRGIDKGGCNPLPAIADPYRRSSVHSYNHPYEGSSKDDLTVLSDPDEIELRLRVDPDVK